MVAKVQNSRFWHIHTHTYIHMDGTKRLTLLHICAQGKSQELVTLTEAAIALKFSSSTSNCKQYYYTQQEISHTHTRTHAHTHTHTHTNVLCCHALRISQPIVSSP